QTYGPASAKDIAHFFQAKQRSVHQWVKLLQQQKKLCSVACEGREELLLAAEDLDVLQVDAPEYSEAWPLRFLPLYDTMLMAHFDKSWTVPNAPEKKHVWRKAAHVMAVVLKRGRIVATWQQKKKRNALQIEIHPMSLWSTKRHKKAAFQEAEYVAVQQGYTNVEVSVAL
ncbi:MAG: crosslink repair DNA glycosylase YcaQ family protein, partial [Myxococcota bacterium]